MSNTPPDTPASRLSPASATQAQHPQSCVLCAHRKVKCDRILPACSNCIKGGSSCEYKTPQPRGPRKRKQTHEENESTLRKRLVKYEQVLRALGVAEPENMPLDLSGRVLPERESKSPYHFFESGTGQGRMMTEDGTQRYTENNLWELVVDAVPDHEHDDDESDDEAADFKHASEANGNHLTTPGTEAESLVLGIRDKHDYDHIELTPSHASRLWTAFIDNVYPISKLIHAPSFHLQYLAAVEAPDRSSKAMLALVAAMQFAAAVSYPASASEADFGYSHQHFVHRLRSRCIHALINARFMSSVELNTMQAFVTFLMAARPDMNPRALWNMAGVGIRMAQTIGLHSNSATSKFPPFEAEMRRRLWREICVLDGHSSELSGFTPSPIILQADNKPPGTYNDSDLTPSMTEMPPEPVGATDTMFMSARNAGGTYARKSGLAGLFMSVSKQQDANPAEIAILDRTLDQMEEMYEQKFLRYCDPVIPEHQLCTILARTVVSRLRMKVHHPRRHEDPQKTLTQEERDISFRHALKVLEYDNLALTSPSLRGFQWHMRSFFQWDGFIYVLSELRNRTIDAETKRAWLNVEQAFANRPELLEDQQKVLHHAVGCLCLKAWDARQTELAEKDPMTALLSDPPLYIQRLRELQAAREAKAKQRQQHHQQRQQLVSKSSMLRHEPDASQQMPTSNQDIASFNAASHQAPAAEPWVMPHQDFDPSFPIPNQTDAGLGLASLPSDFDFTFDMPFSNPFSSNLFENSDSSMMDWTGWDDLVKGAQMTGPSVGGGIR